MGPNDVPSLAGRWAGTINLPSGRPETGTLDLAANGDYAVQTAQRPDGTQVLTGNGHSGTGPFSFEVVRQK